MPLDRKVKLGSATSAITGIVTWLLVAIFHANLSPDLQAAIPVLVASVLGWVVAYLAKHDPSILDLRKHPIEE